MSLPCPDGKVRNPLTNRCVNIDGRIGKNLRSSPRRSPARRSLFSVKGYEIEKALGEGGFGVTYLGRKQGKAYAVKEMEHADAVAEYRVLKKLANVCSHHVLCPVELIRTRDHAYLVSDFVKGHDLERYLRRTENARVTRGFIMSLAEQMLDALATIHRLGIAHRDIKVENIMTTPDRRTFTLIDFGLGATRGTRSLYGTRLYIAPTVYELKEAGKVIPLDVLFSSDLFALGVTLFELLEGGKYPFKQTERGVTRTTAVYDTPERVPYDVTARRKDITSTKAPAWMRALIEYMIYVSNWNEYALFTAEDMYRAVKNKKYAVIQEALSSAFEAL